MKQLASLALVLSVSLLAGCSTSAWYTAVQGAGYDQCEGLKDPSERSRCKAAKYPDEDKYKRERAKSE